MTYTDSSPDGTYRIRLPAGSAAVLSDYLERCDSRQIPPDTDLFLTATDRLKRDNIFTALSLCINIIRIGTTLVFPNGERFGRDDMNANLALRLVLELATLDETSRQAGAV